MVKVVERGALPVDDRTSSCQRLMADRLQLRIGTRGSRLALAQAGWVAEELKARWPDLVVTLSPIKTTGDKILDVPLAKVGGKGLFVKEIEEALLQGRIDLAVHSLKDLPVELPQGLVIGATPIREDPRDVLISKDKRTFSELPLRARIGTSSLRRKVQLLYARPDLDILPLRGNLDTRIRKLETEDLHAIVVAAAGVKRLGITARITEYLPEEISIPAIGQGALAVEVREDDEETLKLAKALDHWETRQATKAERAFLQRLFGSCQVPIAAYAKIANGRLIISGMVASLDGKRLVRETMEGDPAGAEALGIALAEKLLASGADRILAEIIQGGALAPMIDLQH